jgi:hypothetical protein
MHENFFHYHWTQTLTTFRRQSAFVFCEEESRLFMHPYFVFSEDAALRTCNVTGLSLTLWQQINKQQFSLSLFCWNLTNFIHEVKHKAFGRKRESNRRICAVSRTLGQDAQCNLRPPQLDAWSGHQSTSGLQCDQHKNLQTIVERVGHKAYRFQSAAEHVGIPSGGWPTLSPLSS